MNFLKKLLTNTGPKPFFERRLLVDKFLIGKNFSYLNKEVSKNILNISQNFTSSKSR